MILQGPTTPSLCVGILVGGEGRRMGGIAKGLLPTDDGSPIVERLAREVRHAAADARIVLLGARREYIDFGLECLPDSPSGVGPLGGLRALLRSGADEVVLLGGDLAHLRRPLIRRLLDAEYACAVGVKTGQPGRWNPMFARFRTAQSLPVVDAQLQKGRHGLYELLNALDASCLPLDDDEVFELRDWDTAEDVDVGSA